MAYSSTSDIQEQISADELVELTDDAGIGVVDENVVARAIADADAEIDGYLAGRFAVPVTPTPAQVRKLSVDIAVYNLHSRRGEPPAHRRTRYEDALRKLEKTAEGKLTLGIQPPPEAPGKDDVAPTITVSARDKLFDRDTMDNY